MVHMVIHPSMNGSVEYHPFEDLESAVAYVEAQRNAGVDEARLYELHEIPLTVRSYFKVEVGATEVAEPPATEVQTVTEDAEAKVVEAAEQIVEDSSSDRANAFDVSSNQTSTNGASRSEETRRGLFGR